VVKLFRYYPGLEHLFHRFGAMPKPSSKVDPIGKRIEPWSQVEANSPNTGLSDFIEIDPQKNHMAANFLRCCQHDIK
jgi:hypothetical protein